MEFNQYYHTDAGSGSFSLPFKQAILNEDCARGSQSLSSTLLSSNTVPPEDFTQACSSWQSQHYPIQMVDHTQNFTQNRIVLDKNECGSESDLYGLVSHILEETEQVKREPSNLTSVWSPYSVKQSSQHNLHLESDLQSASSFLEIHPDQFNRGKGESMNEDCLHRNDFPDYFNSSDIGDQWFCPPNKRDTDASLLQNQNVQAISSYNNFLAKNMPDNHNSNSTGVDERFLIVNPLCDQAGRETPSGCSVSKMANQFFDLCTEYSNQSQLNPSGTNAFFVQEKIKPDNSMEKLLFTEEDINECQNKQIGKMFYRDHFPDQYSCALSWMQTFERQGTFRKEFSDFEVEKSPKQTGKMTSPSNAFYSKDFHAFSHHPTEYSPETKSFSSAFSAVPSFLSKYTMQKYNKAPANISQSVPHHDAFNIHQNWARQLRSCGAPGPSNDPSFCGAQFASQQFQQIQRNMPSFPESSFVNGHCFYNSVAQNQAKLKLEEVRKSSGDSEFDLELYNRIMRNNLVSKAASSQPFVDQTKLQFSSQTEQENKQAMLQNSYLDLQGNVFHSYKHRGGSGTNSGKLQPHPFVSYVHSMGDLKEAPWSLQGRFSSRSAFPVAPRDLCNVGPGSEPYVFKPYLDMTSTVHPVPVAASVIGLPSLPKNTCGPASQLYFFLEECYEHWRMLEKDRKKTENILAKNFPAKRTSVVSSCPIPKAPPNPSRVDRLIVGQLREQARITSILWKMERLRSIPLHADICSTLDKHLEAVYIVQARRKKEFLNTSRRQREADAHFGEDRDVLLLAAALKDLSRSTRRCRTVLWCALQTTLPRKSSAVLDEQVAVYT